MSRAYRRIQIISGALKGTNGNDRGLDTKEKDAADVIGNVVSSHRKNTKVDAADYFNTVSDLIKDGLVADGVFRDISLSQCYPVKSYQRLRQSKPIRQLLELFHQAGLPCEMGFNFGSESISFVFNLKESKPESAIKSAKNAIIWCMFGLLPDDAHMRLELENARVMVEEEETLAPSQSLRLVANLCHDLFLFGTGIAIADRSIDLTNNQLKIVIDRARRRMRNKIDGLLYMDNAERPFQFSPSYYSLSGRLSDYTGPGIMYKEEVRKKQQLVLVENIISDFWDVVSEMFYYPDADLKKNVELQLQSYCVAATTSPKASFSPNHSLSLYLHGTAGSGKSRFVEVLLYALRCVVHKYIEPQKRVDIVRVPLNATSPGNLMRVLLVRGISDWSVERIMEQSISRGGLVVLHLEETPKDRNLQIQYMELIEKMVRQLETRYPEYRNHVVFVFTSNYPAVDEIVARAPSVIVRPPGPDIQRKWCERTLSHVLEQALDSDCEVNVRLYVDPPMDRDMRKLERWRRGLTFLISMHLKKFAKALRKLNVCNIQLKGTTKELMVKFSAKIPILRLKSHDSYFYFEEASREYTSHPVLFEHKIPLDLHPRILTILYMLKYDFVKPGVIVLTGKEEARNRFEMAILEVAKSVFGNGNFSEFSFVARTDEDRSRIFGDPDPSKGEIQRFVDSINNPIYERDDHFALISAHVSDVGQFMLRELLETGTSQTHVTVIRKERLLFIVSMDDSTEVSPQMASRAHDIILCT